MFFDYQGWRIQLRDKIITPKGNQNFTPYKKTEIYAFQHYEEHEKRGPVRTHPPHLKKNNWGWYKGFLKRWCQTCGKEMPWEVQDYFSKAIELWRLADPKQ